MLFHISKIILMLPILILTSINISVCAKESDQFNVIAGPVNTTASSGVNVTLECRVNAITSELIEWFEYITIPIGNKIYSSLDGIIGDPAKYAVDTNGVGIYNLIIIQSNTSDGGLYGCITEDDIMSADASLVVVSTPILNFVDVMDENAAYNISCSVEFSSIDIDNLGMDQKPYIQVYVGDRLEEGENITEQIDANRFIQHKIIYYAALATDHRADVVCYVRTDVPQYVRTVSKELNITYSARDIVISPRKPVYGVGEKVYCTANSNPTSFYEWSPIQSPDDSHSYSSELVITKEMIGQNTWNCDASNGIDDVTVSSILGPFVVDINQCAGRTFFSAHLNHDQDYLFQQGEIIPYNRIFSNCGEAYSSATGTFICPADGYYEFYVNTRAAGRTRAAAVNVMMDSSLLFYVVSPTTVDDLDYRALVASNSVVVRCPQGATVWVEQAIEAGSYFEDCCMHNTFSGILL